MSSHLKHAMQLRYLAERNITPTDTLFEKLGAHDILAIEADAAALERQAAHDQIYVDIDAMNAAFAEGRGWVKP